MSKIYPRRIERPGSPKSPKRARVGTPMLGSQSNGFSHHENLRLQGELDIALAKIEELEEQLKLISEGKDIDKKRRKDFKKTWIRLKN